MENNNNIADKLIEFLGKDGIRWFGHLKGLTGTCSPVLRLNSKRKGIPVHPVHFREGMQIRNFLRTLKECEEINFDDEWCSLVELAVERSKIIRE
jgi:hypothetical protein